MVFNSPIRIFIERLCLGSSRVIILQIYPLETRKNLHIIIRGGSFWNPLSSQWYLKGGPQPLDEHPTLLLVSPGFDRSPNVGFRCVKDAAR